MLQVKREYAIEKVREMFLDIFSDLWRNRFTGDYNYVSSIVDYDNIWRVVDKMFDRYGYKYYDDLHLLVFQDLNKYKKYAGLNEIENIFATLLVCLQNEGDDYREIILEDGLINGMFYDLEYLYMRFILSYNAEDIELYPED